MKMKKISVAALSCIAAGMIMSSTAQADVDTHVVEITGNVVANTCELFQSSAAKVNLDDISLQALSGAVGDVAAAGKTTYTLGLENCVPGSNGEMTITYAPVSGMATTIDNTGSAEGVAFKFTEANDSEITVGQKIDFAVDDSGQFEKDFNIGYQKTAANPTLGTVQGSVTFNFNYL
jgi:type 1 fimbria pilin